YPSITSLVAFLFQVVVAIFPSIKIQHARKGLLHCFKEMQYGFALGRYIQLCVQINTNSKIITQRTIGVHGSFYSMYVAILRVDSVKFPNSFFAKGNEFARGDYMAIEPR